MIHRNRLHTWLCALTPTLFNELMSSLEGQLGVGKVSAQVTVQAPPSQRALELLDYLEAKQKLDLLHEDLGRIASSLQPAAQDGRLLGLLDRNPSFTGREEEFTKIAASFAKAKPGTVSRLALCGPPGQGKTHLALEYCYRHVDHYEAILWISAHGDRGIDDSYAAVAGQLGLLVSERPEDVRQRLFQWLQGRSSWLIVLDRVDPPTRLFSEPSGMPLWPQMAQAQGRGHILVTTRAADSRVPGNLPPLQLAELSLPDAVNFLRSYAHEAREDEDSVIQELARELHQVPLALKQACEYMNDRRETFKWVLARARSDLFRLLFYKLPQGQHSERALSDCYTQLREDLETTHPASLDLLRLAAMLGAERIPCAIFLHGAEEMGPELAMCLAQPDDPTGALDRLLEPLLGCSAVRRDSASLFSLNRLVRLFIQQMADEVKFGVWAERAVRSVHRAFLATKNSPSERLLILPHIAQVTRLLDKDQRRCSAEKAQLVHQAALFLKEQSQTEKSKEWLNRAIDLHNDILQSAQLNMARALLDLAQWELENRDFHSSALQCFKAVSLLSVLQNAWPVVEDTGQSSLQHRASLYERAIEILERIPNVEPTSYLQSLDELAGLYVRQGRIEAAFPLILRAKQLRQSVLGPRHPEVAKCLSYLGTLYRQMGRPQDAEPLLRESLLILDGVPGITASMLLPYLGELGAVLRELKRDDEASALAARAAALTVQGDFKTISPS